MCKCLGLYLKFLKSNEDSSFKFISVWGHIEVYEIR